MKETFTRKCGSLIRKDVVESTDDSVMTYNWYEVENLEKVDRIKSSFEVAEDMIANVCCMGVDVKSKWFDADCNINDFVLDMKDVIFRDKQHRYGHPFRNMSDTLLLHAYKTTLKKLRNFAK